uniref:PXA domain-containing protein n=1 Tax=Acrobeloides nanus TaxID=290746 RepID=A0A914C725_9BILA
MAYELTLWQGVAIFVALFAVYSFDWVTLCFCALFFGIGYGLALQFSRGKTSVFAHIVARYRDYVIEKNDALIQTIAPSTEIKENLPITESLNLAIEELIETIMRNYIKKWYLSELGTDNAFIFEIQYHIRFAILRALKSLQKVNLSQVLLDDFLPPLVLHVERVCSLSEKTEKLALPAKEVTILKEFDDLHIALWSRENESNYLRLVGELLTERLVDEYRIGGQEAAFERPLNINGKIWPCHSARHLIREILVSSILLPLLDLLSDPDTINQLILLGMEPDENLERLEVENIQPVSDYVDVAPGTSEMPDSLLALKLSDIVRDPRLLQLFNMFLRDQRGPNNYLDCFLLAYEIQHNRLEVHTYPDNQAIFNELQSDAWQLYGDYVHESAPNRIDFPDEIVKEFTLAFDMKDLKLLLKATEEVYKNLYEHLNSQFVVQFCQSEMYLSYLCGSPPDVQEFIRGPIDSPELKQEKSTEGSFSLSQFRNRLFNLMTLRYDSETLDPDGKEATSPNPNAQVEIGDIALIDLTKNLNRWNVYITKIEPRKDSAGRLYYVYVIYVERNDLSSDSDSGLDLEALPSSWIIGRKYDELFALDERLVEFHGSAVRLGLLPDKKPMQARSRAFMETQRVQFERYLQALIQQPFLKRSELLYSFLTSDEEAFETTIISELNPFKVMRKVPNKLARERGQNLKPFILNVLANILAPTSFQVEPPSQQQYSDENSISSFTDESHDNRYFGSKIALDNLQISRSLNEAKDYSQSFIFIQCWRRNIFDAFLFVAFRLARFSRYILSILVAIQVFAARSVNSLTKYFTSQLVRWTLKEQHLIYLIRILESTMNGPQNPLPSEQEIRLRAELAQRRLDDYIEESLSTAGVKALMDSKRLRLFVQRLFEALQYPRLNKQLVLVLMDIIVEKIQQPGIQENSEMSM